MEKWSVHNCLILPHLFAHTPAVGEYRKFGVLLLIVVSGSSKSLIDLMWINRWVELELCMESVIANTTAIKRWWIFDELWICSWCVTQNVHTREISVLGFMLRIIRWNITEALLCHLGSCFDSGIGAVKMSGVLSCCFWTGKIWLLVWRKCSVSKYEGKTGRSPAISITSRPVSSCGWAFADTSVIFKDVWSY